MASTSSFKSSKDEDRTGEIMDKGLDIGDHVNAEKSEDIEETEEHEQSIHAKQIKESTLQRIITGRSTTSYIDPGPPPDGGFRAWLMAIMSLFVVFNSWGYIQVVS